MGYDAYQLLSNYLVSADQSVIDKMNELFYGLPNPPSPSLAAPQTIEQMTVGGNWTPEVAATETMANYKQQLQDFYAGIPDTSSRGFGTLLVIGGGLLLVLWLMKK